MQLHLEVMQETLSTFLFMLKNCTARKKKPKKKMLVQKSAMFE